MTGGGSDPLDLAASALARRDLSAAALTERLRRAGAGETAAGAAVARLASLGALDDARLAVARASRLAERGYGNAAIEARLESEGLGRTEIEAAVLGLEPEAARARGIAATAPGRSRRALAATLARRGFAPDSLEAALGSLDAADEAELG
ncbi:MAG: RecX family transcriptional regulator [Thermoleophilia bacterium]|nr:RecX family transcriptional regulator [Thermoleophilia bacterium]